MNDTETDIEQKQSEDLADSAAEDNVLEDNEHVDNEHVDNERVDDKYAQNASTNVASIDNAPVTEGSVDNASMTDGPAENTFTTSAPAYNASITDMPANSTYITNESAETGQPVLPISRPVSPLVISVPDIPEVPKISVTARTTAIPTVSFQPDSDTAQADSARVKPGYAKTAQEDHADSVHGDADYSGADHTYPDTVPINQVDHDAVQVNYPDSHQSYSDNVHEDSRQEHQVQADPSSTDSVQADSAAMNHAHLDPAQAPTDTDYSKPTSVAPRVVSSAGAAVPKKPWYGFLTPVLGKFIRWGTRLLRHGGSAFPGKVVEGFDHGFLARTLAQLPYGVVLVSGTNGKTTTTRMVASILEKLGLKVFTNPTGSNFTRGVVSALVSEVDMSGRLNADIAVLELDEAYAVHFVEQVSPRYALLLNVMRDQLDRFGEIDNTARLLSHVAAATTGTVVLNREDTRIAKLSGDVRPTAKVSYFGLVNSLRSFFPSDDDMHAGDTGASPRLTLDRQAFESTAQPADVTLKSVDDHNTGDHSVEFLIDGQSVATTVKLEGVYNLFNAAAALAVVRAVIADTGMHIDNTALMSALAQVTPAFGRGEVIDVNGTPVELLLVKNPMGFRLSLSSFPAQGCDTMIAINDEYADGRDMSWLWDVDFMSLRDTGVAVVSGTRAWDMALRLQYDQVDAVHTQTDLEQAVEAFVMANPGVPKHMYCTYTAMLQARTVLSHMTQVADAGVGQ